MDDEGEVLEVLVQSCRTKRAALKLMRKLLKKQGYIPDEIVNDKLGSYFGALRELGFNVRFVKEPTPAAAILFPDQRDAHCRVGC